MHARLGEVLYMAASTTEGSAAKYLAESIKRFSRSIELCDDYLRGYYGLKLATGKVLKDSPKESAKQDNGDFSLPSTQTTEKLNELATKKLAEIVRRNNAGESLWQGYKKTEVDAAKELLEKDSPELVR